MKTIAALALLLLWTCYAAPAHAAFGDELFKLTASDGAVNNSFGRSVAISGHTGLVGGEGDNDAGPYSGSAYLFDVATDQQLFKLTASDAAEGDQFGISVALSGNRALVGAFSDDNSAGSAYLFDVATGQQLIKLTASDAAPLDGFGYSVALSGNTALIGAIGNDAAGLSSGSAYLFDITTGQQLFKLTAFDGAANDGFGISVAISGNRALVGTQQFDDGFGVDGPGAAYLFDITTGQQLFKFTAADAAESNVYLFGRSVSLSGDIALIGAPGVRSDVDGAGSAYLFDVTTGQQLLKLTASDATKFDSFGYSVALSGNRALVAAPGDDGASGSAYLFDVTTGQLLFKLIASDAAGSDVFGASVALSGNRALVGAYGDDNEKGSGAGAAYLFDVVPETNSAVLILMSACGGLWFRRVRGIGP